MQPFKSIIPIFALFMALQSCGKAIFPTHEHVLNTNDPASLNGTYKPQSLDTTIENNQLWNVLIKRPGPHGYKPMSYPPGSRIVITKKTNRKLLLELYSSSSIVQKKTLKGEMDGNAFRMKKRTRYFGLPFIYMKLSFYQLQISKHENGQLLVDVADSHGGMVLIFSGGDTVPYLFNYESEHSR